MAETGREPAPKTLIRGGWIVGFDGEEHRILKDGVVVYEGDTILHVGRDYDEPVEREIDARGNLVIPGLINSHVHIGAHAGDRMILDAGRREMFRSGFMNYCTTKGIGGPTIGAYEVPEATIRYSLASLARFGATTILEMGGDFSGDMGALLRLAGELGVRLYTCPGFSSAHHYYDQGGRHHLHWDEGKGLAGLDEAAAFIAEHDGDHDGLFRGILVPFEFHLCSQELLRRTKEVAGELGVGITLHLAESVAEFHDTVRQTGRTPVGVLQDLEFLGPEVILGHGLYTGGHSQIAYPFEGDLAALVETGTNVAHCPLVFGRRGVTLESAQRYREHGVNLSIGTDTYPQDIVGELQFASLFSKITDHDFESMQTREVFNAATLGGARALGRDDLGRLAPGAKADIVIADFSRLRIGPFLDPIKALIHCGNGEVVDTVIVAGHEVVKGGHMVAWDEEELLASVRASTDTAWGHFADYHPGNEAIDEVYPSAFKAWEG